MCRNITNLRRLDHDAATEDFEAAARQYVRKISGFQKPSRLNESVFEAAIAEIAVTSERLLGDLVVRGSAGTAP